MPSTTADADEAFTSPMHALSSLLIRSLHAHCQAPPAAAASAAAPRVHAAMYVVGAGSLAPAWTTSVPGASSWLREARVPYARTALRDAVHDAKLESFCSEETAGKMAAAALGRAMEVASGEVGLEFPRGTMAVGLGLTGSLATAQPKRGKHRAHVCVRRHDGFEHVVHVDVTGAGWGRAQEEEFTSLVALRALAEAMLPPAAMPASWDDVKALAPGVKWERCETLREPVFVDALSCFSHLTAGTAGVETVLCTSACEAFVNVPLKNVLVFPGSFNPLHHGHTALADAARRRFPDRELVYEIAAVNADKPPVDPAELQRRLSLFIDARGIHPPPNGNVVVTRAPKFADKSRVFKDSVFVLGADTALRLVDPKYTRGSRDEMLAELYRMVFADRNRFLVAGRLTSGSGAFTGSSAVVTAALPPPLVEAGFVFLAESEFRVDVSSTEIRARLASSSSSSLTSSLGVAAEGGVSGAAGLARSPSAEVQSAAPTPTATPGAGSAAKKSRI